jgi:hypothetical protein
MFDELIKFFGPAGIPAISAAAIFGVFEFAEKVVSKPAKTALTDHLKALQVQDAVVLPVGARALFNRVFGDRQFTFKCLVRSIIFSILAIGLISLISFPNRRSLGDLILVDQFTRTYFFIWVPISLIPDYLNLYKTRIVTNILEKQNGLSIWGLLLTICCDFIFGVVLFLIFSRLAVAAAISLSRSGSFDLSSISFVVSFFINTFSVILDPLVWFNYLTLKELEAPLLYAGMLASVWLWIYIFSLIGVRVILRSSRFLQAARWALDIEEHPLRSVGVVAAALVFVLVGLISGLKQLL